MPPVIRLPSTLFVSDPEVTKNRLFLSKVRQTSHRRRSSKLLETTVGYQPKMWRRWYACPCPHWTGQNLLL